MRLFLLFRGGFQCLCNEASVRPNPHTHDTRPTTHSVAVETRGDALHETRFELRQAARHTNAVIHVLLHMPRRSPRELHDILERHILLYHFPSLHSGTLSYDQKYTPKLRGTSSYRAVVSSIRREGLLKMSSVNGRRCSFIPLDASPHAQRTWLRGSRV